MDKLIKAVMDRDHSAVYVVQRDYLFDYMTHRASDIMAMAPMVIVDGRGGIQGLLLSECFNFRFVSVDLIDAYILKADLQVGDNHYNDFVDARPGLNNIENDVTLRQLYDFIVDNLP